MSVVWRVSLAAAADADIEEILRWTTVKFGQRQALIYEETIFLAIDALTQGPAMSGARRRSDLMPDVYTLHVARKRRRGSHILVVRIIGEKSAEVVRVLHEAMDIVRHLPDA